MENGFAPDEIEASIIYEDLEVVKAWLDAGGDPPPRLILLLVLKTCQTGRCYN